MNLKPLARSVILLPLYFATACTPTPSSNSNTPAAENSTSSNTAGGGADAPKGPVFGNGGTTRKIDFVSDPSGPPAPATPTTRATAPAAANLPVTISPPLDNNTNPPEMAKNATGVQGTIERLDPALDELLAADAKVEILAEGISWAEGPVWYKGGLLFSDIPQNAIYRWTPEDGIHLFMQPSGYTGTEKRGGEPGTNALTLDGEGRLTMCQHGDRRVVRLEKDNKTLTVLADKYKGMRFSSPNDLCYDHAGNLYFSDPPYGLVDRDKDPKKEMDHNAVYLRRVDGEIIRLETPDIIYADGKTAPLVFPNGVALSPDQKTLYVCVSDPDHPVFMKYDVQADGTVKNGHVFFDTAPMFAQKLPGLPDGIKCDVKGNVWATGPGGVFIFTPEGRHIGTLLTNDRTANIGWGDDGSTLYICCNHKLCRIKTKTKGVFPASN